MFFNYSWLVMTKDHGLVQVDADECALSYGAATFYKHTEDKQGTGEFYVLCSFPPGSWSSVEVMSQASGYGNGFTRLEDNKAKGRGKK